MTMIQPSSYQSEKEKRNATFATKSNISMLIIFCHAETLWGNRVQAHARVRMVWCGVLLGAAGFKGGSSSDRPVFHEFSS